MSAPPLRQGAVDGSEHARERRRERVERADRGEVSVQSSVPIAILGGTASDFISFSPFDDDREHFAIRLGGVRALDAPLVRIHSECVTGDVFSSARCDCGAQLREAVQRISKAGGFILYLRQEGRGIGLASKLKAYKLQDKGLDTYEANAAIDMPHDKRSYGAAAAMLSALGVRRIRLLTNNPRKVSEIEALGITVVERVPTGVFLTEQNARYIEAKRTKGGHLL